ncbi:MAG: ubiquinol-cytochrome c reductase iron-sulfur subunit [Solirubrobacteraceae bacterium]
MNEPRPRFPRLVRLWVALLVALRLRRGERGRLAVDESSYGSEPSAAIEHEAGAERQTGASPRAEVGVAIALLIAGALSVGFCLLYAFDGSDTQLLGLAIGLALLAIATALILAADRVFPRETAVEPRPVLAERREPLEAQVAEDAAAAGEGMSRRRLLRVAAGVAGTGLGAAVIVPLDSLGPNVGQRFDTTPWKNGTPLVNEQGNPLTAEDAIQGSFATAFPQGANRRELGAPVVVVRVDPSTLRLPASRAHWAPEGILAYSKICTHAGCAVALYRSPLNEQTSQPPALVCPCHYSTFDVRRGAAVEFGPAGRPLPQLPLAIRSDRVLVARGGFSGPIGPAWWSVRVEGPTKS